MKSKLKQAPEEPLLIDYDCAAYYILSEDLIEKYIYILNPLDVLKCQELSNDFLLRYIKKLCKKHMYSGTAHDIVLSRFDVTPEIIASYFIDSESLPILAYNPYKPLLKTEIQLLLIKEIGYNQSIIWFKLTPEAEVILKLESL